MDALIDKALPYLLCPSCTNSMLENKPTEQQVSCRHCKADYPYHAGFLDLWPQKAPSNGLAQKTMENKFVVSIYEDYVRPNFIALGSALKYADEDSWLEEQLPPGTPKIALDIACGTGRYARWLSDKYGCDLILATDISEPMLTKSAENNQSLGYTNILNVRCDACKLPIRDQVIDWTNCFGALHLFPEPYQAMAEVARVNTANSLFTFLTAGRQNNSTITKNVQKLFSKLADFVFFDKDKLETELVTLGFNEVTIEQHGMMLLSSIRKQQNIEATLKNTA